MMLPQVMHLIHVCVINSSSAINIHYQILLDFISYNSSSRQATQSRILKFKNVRENGTQAKIDKKKNKKKIRFDFNVLDLIEQVFLELATQMSE
jgi:hypothetical protein